MMLSKRTRIAGLSVAVACAAYVNISGAFDDETPETRVGTAGVALGEDTARVVERVSYRQDIERVGDVIVVDGQPVEPLEGELAMVWEIVDATWPMSHRDRLAQVSVVREEPRGLVGVVHPSATGGWILSLDIADVDDRALIEETIVHELSHVATLAREVFTFGTVEDCSGVEIALGCAEEATVLAEFADRFWPDDQASQDPSHFVDDYASSAAHEDLAETFTAWVLGWPVDDTMNASVVNAKIDLLAGDAALAELADALRIRIRPSPAGR